MIRKTVSLIFCVAVILVMVSPISMAATAPFTYYTTLSMPTLTSNQWGFVFASDDSNGLYAIFECDAIPYYTSGRGFVPDYASGYPGFILNLSQDFSGSVNFSLYDLDHGYLLATETKTISSTNRIDITFFRSADIKISTHLSTPAYCYPLGSSVLTDSSTVYPLADPFVSWNSSPPSPDPPSPPVDPTEVIRSRIPRPYGHATTMYIADHLYLYAIYMGIPQQFEGQGVINTNNPDQTFTENVNIYQVYFSGSGSTLSFTVINRAQFSYNAIITKYDVVDGTFVSSNSYAITAATSYNIPGESHFSISLSDPETYGIYQSGFFARHLSISYPELRISWSDTIDYSLDFFVIRQGLVTIVENQTTINNQLSTANSTLTTISSTASQILTTINSFYSLCDGYFTWFKTTYYNNLNSKWDVTNHYIIAIYNLLRSSDETIAIDDDMSEVDEMQSVKSELVVTNSSGQSIDPAGAAAENFSVAASEIGDLAAPVATINNLMQSIVFDKPKLVLPIIVALALGLMVTIMGKNKSD